MAFEIEQKFLYYYYYYYFSKRTIKTAQNSCSKSIFKFEEDRGSRKGVSFEDSKFKGGGAILSH